MLVYVDSSALIKRSIAEAESDQLATALDEHVEAGNVLITSAVTWIEVSRAIRSLLTTSLPEDEIQDWIEITLSGVAQHPISRHVISLARRVNPPVLRSLDAVHLSTALLVDPLAVISYDERLSAACASNGLTVSSPGRS